MLQIRRLGYALGARVEGLDVTQPLADETIDEIRQAWGEHLVLCFPGPDLSPNEQADFCSRFGEIDVKLKPPGALAGNPEVALIANMPIDVEGQAILPARADEWHSDLSFSDRPGTASFLLAKRLPSAGGDTQFANTYLAYEALSPAMQRLAESLESVHDVTLAVGHRFFSPEKRAQRIHDFPLVVHPLVRVHPETGRKALFVGSSLRRFVGMSEEESQPIRSFLMQHSTRYEFTYRHRWTTGDLLMWDNRCTMHYAVQDYDPKELRTMQRCALIAPQSGYFLDPQREAVLA